MIVPRVQVQTMSLRAIIPKAVTRSTRPKMSSPTAMMAAQATLDTMAAIR